MVAITPGSLYLAWSYRRELYYVLLTFILVLLLPFIAVFTISNTGIQGVSNALVTVNASSHGVELKDPVTGKVIKEIFPNTVWPVVGTVTLEFGASDLPYQPFHTGIDIASNRGDLISPFMDGTVTFVGDLSWGYGKHVIIDNGDNITSLYAHMDSVFVKAGQKVHTGDAIGAEGSTGWATGPHVHFETRIDGIPVNPRTFLK